MPFVSVTRLRVRSYWYLAQFMVWALRSPRQAQRSSGFLGGRLIREAENVLWTLTVWRDDAAMNAHRTAGAHRIVIPKLLNWCDEASLVHWTQETAGVPEWNDAHQRLVKEGRPSKPEHPSPAHLAHQILPPHPGRFSSPLNPMNPSYSADVPPYRSA